MIIGVHPEICTLQACVVLRKAKADAAHVLPCVPSSERHVRVSDDFPRQSGQKDRRVCPFLVRRCLPPHKSSRFFFVQIPLDKCLSLNQFPHPGRSVDATLFLPLFSFSFLLLFLSFFFSDAISL